MISRVFWYLILLLGISVDFLKLLFSLVHTIYAKVFDFESISPEKVLLVRTDRLGDAVITTPLIKALKEQMPGLKIYLISSTKNEVVFKNNHDVDKIFSIKIDSWLEYKHRRYSSFAFFHNFFKEQLFDKKFWKALLQLKLQNIDLSLDLVGMKRTSLFGKLIGKYSITHNLKEFNYLADYCLDFPFVSPYPRMHIVERYFYLASKGVKNMEWDRVDPFKYGLELYMCEEAPIKSRDSILIHIGGTDYRRLDNTRLLNIIKDVSERSGHKIYLIDEPGNPNIEFFKENLANYEVQFIENIKLEDLTDFVARSVFLAVVSDSGVAHIFNAITNTFVYFGPGAVWVWYPWDTSKPQHIKTYENGVQVWQTKGKYLHKFIFYPIDCSPCYDIGCKELDCLKPLKADFFVEQIEEMTRNNKGGDND